MNISPINNSHTNNRNFGAIKGTEKLSNYVLDSFLENPEFTKLAIKLEKEGKDLYIEELLDGAQRVVNLYERNKSLFGTKKRICYFNSEFAMSWYHKMQKFSVDSLEKRMKEEFEAEARKQSQRNSFLKLIDELNKSMTSNK